jgi:hypothetical protein
MLISENIIGEKNTQLGRFTMNNHAVIRARCPEVYKTISNNQASKKVED